MCVKASRTSTSLVEGVALLVPQQLGSVCCCRSGHGAMQPVSHHLYSLPQCVQSQSELGRLQVLFT